MMFGFARRRQELLEAELQRFLGEVLPFGALRMYVIGDLARGQTKPDTELELVVVQATDQPYQRRADFWVTHLRPRVGTRFLVYTPEEFDDLAETDPILQEAQRIGMAVVG
jgi:hypothetical protein